MGKNRCYLWLVVFKVSRATTRRRIEPSLWCGSEYDTTTLKQLVGEEKDKEKA